MDFKVGKKYRQRDGLVAEIDVIKPDAVYPVRGWVYLLDGHALYRSWDFVGRCYKEQESGKDLVEELPVEVEPAKQDEEPLLPGHRWLIAGEDKLQAGDTYYHLGEVKKVEERCFGQGVNLEEAFMRKIETPEPKPATTISMDKTYKTRSGLAVRCYQTDAGGKYPVHGAVWSAPNQCWQQITWTAEGAYRLDGPSDLDLVEVKPRIQREYWVNLYRNDKKDRMWETQKDANEAASASKGRIACVKVVIDCEEGEGLE